MPDTRERLASCFAVAFPELSEAEIPLASHSSIANWDSLATVTLVSLVEEEFKISVPPEDFDYMVSFELALDCVTRRTRDGS